MRKRSVRPQRNLTGFSGSAALIRGRDRGCPPSGAGGPAACAAAEPWAPARPERRPVGDRRRERGRDRLALAPRRRHLVRPHRRRPGHEPRPDHRAPRGLLRARPGAPARPAPVARAARRLRPADRVAPAQRQARALPHPRPRRADHGRLRVDGPDLGAERGIAAAQQLPGDDHRHRRDGAVHRRRRHLARDRAAAAPVRVVVRGAPHRLCRDRAQLVPRDPDRQRADRPSGRGRLLARALHRDARAARRLPRRAAAHAHARARAARRGGRRGRPRRRLAAHRRPPARAARRARGAVLPLAVPVAPRPLVGGAPVLALGGSGRAVVPDHREGRRRVHARAARRAARERA